MDFKHATDALFERTTHEELARELEASIPAIRQARLAPTSKAYRTPPEGWERAIVRVAESRIRRYRALIGKLKPGA